MLSFVIILIETDSVCCESSLSHVLKKGLECERSSATIDSPQEPWLHYFIERRFQEVSVLLYYILRRSCRHLLPTTTISDPGEIGLETAMQFRYQANTPGRTLHGLSTLLSSSHVIQIIQYFSRMIVVSRTFSTPSLYTVLLLRDSAKIA